MDQLDHLRTAAEVARISPASFHLPDERQIIANRIRLHYLEWGETTLPPVVFLHGGSLTAHTWDLICLSLSDRYRCIAIDMRGHGESEWPADADYALETMAEDIGGVIDQLALQRPVVVGMSLGGLTSLRLAGERSATLAGLVIVDVGPDLHTDGAQQIVAFTQQDQEMDSVEDFVARAMRFNSTRRPELLRRSLLHNLRKLPSGRWTWKWDKRRMHAPDFERMKADHARLWDSVAKIVCPTLIVRGDRSRVFFDADGEKLAGAIEGASFVVVENSGHTVQGDNPRGLLDVLEPFLAASVARQEQ
jgi:pimeloyl-ACP methyl ester carboxylesterase